MKSLKYVFLAMVVAALLVIPAAAQQSDQKAATSPLVQLLKSRGVLTAEDVRQLGEATSAEDANERLARLLVQKGVISTEDYSQTVVADDASANAGRFVNAAVHTSPMYAYSDADGSGSPDQEPVSFKFKGITLTPGGFFSGQTTWRQRAISSGSATPFNSIPFSTSDLGNIGEFNTDARQSLFNFLAEGHLGGTRIRGYFESDFNSAGVTSNNNATNGYTLRIRQAWGQAAFDNGWTITVGQMWSLVTAERQGIEPLAEIIPYVIDSGYVAGFPYARQEGFRVSKSFLDKKLFFALSVENPELNSVAGPACTAGSCLYGAVGNTTGLFNTVTTGVEAQNYSFNASPDFIFKLALEPGFGHWEVFGLVNTFHERFYPCFDASDEAPCAINALIVTPSSFGANNRTTTGGGVGANGYFSLFNKHLDVNASFMGGNGIGRYGGTTGFSDVVFNADQELVALRNYRGYGGLIWHVTPKLDIYGYAGGEYLQRSHNYGQDDGAPIALNAECFTEALPASDVSPGGTCNAVTRDIIEGVGGFWYKFFTGSIGRMQAGVQYSYITRATWAGTTTTTTDDTTTTSSFAPHAVENMIMTSFRYYLP